MRMNWLSISTGCAKILLITLNGFCIITAIFLFGFAVVDTRILTQYGQEAASGTFAGDIVIIVVSLLMTSIALFGCVGACKEKIKLLYLYVGLLMILMVLELLIGIFVSLQRYGLEFRITAWMREDFFRNVTEDQLSVHTNLWDNIQSHYECCGLNGPEDYSALSQDLSMSCCGRAQRAKTPDVQKKLYKQCIDTGTYYDVGCEDVILDVLREDTDWLLGVAVVSLWFEAACMLLSMWIANNLKNSVKVYEKTVRY